jgi:hypothetical protein
MPPQWTFGTWGVWSWAHVPLVYALVWTSILCVHMTWALAQAQGKGKGKGKGPSPRGAGWTGSSGGLGGHVCQVWAWRILIVTLAPFTWLQWWRFIVGSPMIEDDEDDESLYQDTWCKVQFIYIYMVNHGSLFCSNMNPIYVDLSHLRHLRFCFKFHKPFARLWSAPQVCFCLKNMSLDLLDMYFEIFGTICHYFVKITRKFT